jgi:hypothetical protein
MIIFEELRTQLDSYGDFGASLAVLGAARRLARLAVHQVQHVLHARLLQHLQPNLPFECNGMEQNPYGMRIVYV